MQRNVNVVEDLDGKKIVVIHDIIFKGKRTMEWTDDALFIDGEKRISDALLAALILMIEKSRDEDKEMIIRTALNCIC